MIRIVDHLKEKESTLQANLLRIRNALKGGEKVVVVHPAGHIHGRLKNIKGVEYVVEGAAPIHKDHSALLARLTQLQAKGVQIQASPLGDVFIHWYYQKRTIDRLTRCEIFHINMLRHFGIPDRARAIHIRCASEYGMAPAMGPAIELLRGNAEMDFKCVRPNGAWEHDTFKECVEYAIGNTGKTYYIHFKGVSHIADDAITASYRNGSRTNPGRIIEEIDILYWCYLMYRHLFGQEHALPAIGPLLHKGGTTLHYKDGKNTPKWAYHANHHYSGSFQAFDGEYLKRRFDEFGADRAERDKALWVRDPYTVEQFLSMAFRPDEVSTLGEVSASYKMYAANMFPELKAGFNHLYDPGARNICVANGTYKWIGGTDTFNWAMCKAFKDLGYNVYYYAPDMDGNGATEKYLKELGILPYTDNIPLAACFANQQSGRKFIGKCPVVQTCHSAYTDLELPIQGAHALVAVSEEIQAHMEKRGYSMPVMLNGIDLERYRPINPLGETPKVLSICQGDDAALARACGILGWEFHSVPKEVDGRIWHIEDLINQADIVVGIGRSLYDAMACGRVCISWDNRRLNPYSGCGYVTKDNWHEFARTNFTGRGFPKMESVRDLLRELRKYSPDDGKDMRRMAEQELDMAKHAREYLRLAGLPIYAP